jgi:alcohol dehydrogenase (cytochrome c)
LVPRCGRPASGRPGRTGSHPASRAIRALDPLTGERKWEFKRDGTFFKAGALTTASGLLFTGVLGQYPIGNSVDGHLIDGQFYALDAATGQLLWQILLPGSIQSGAVTYAVKGKQYVTVAAGNALFAFALRQ